MEKETFFSKNTQSVKALSEKELLKVLGGDDNHPKPKKEDKDSIDVSSELASGGTTTDTYE